MTQETEVVEQDIELILKELDSRFGTGPDTDRLTCITGDPVVTIIAPAPEGDVVYGGIIKGVKPEGADFPMAETPIAAWVAFQAAFEEYAEGRQGVLFWRMRPYLRQEEGKWYVRARLFIMETPLRRHMGTFRLSGQDMLDKPCQLMEIMGKCIILKAEPLVYADATEYTALSPLFAVNPEGLVPLHYEWIKNDWDEWVVR